MYAGQVVGAASPVAMGVSRGKSRGAGKLLEAERKVGLGTSDSGVKRPQQPCDCPGKVQERSRGRGLTPHAGLGQDG